MNGQVFSQIQDESISRYWDGELINGVCWAKSNVDKPGTFASTPEAYGMYYQWNRKKGLSAADSDWDDNLPSEFCWESVNDPCPMGWRVPTTDELEVLLDDSKVAYVCVSQNGISGGRFTDKITNNVIFLPFAGNLLRRNGELFSGDTGYYSSSEQAIVAGFANYLEFSSWGGLITFLYHFGSVGMSVRCVADEKCDSIVSHDTVTICSMDFPYEWRDTTFGEGTQTGTYRISRRSCAYTDIAYLHLTVQQENEKSCPGVLINDVCWAESNVDEPGTFAATPEVWGMLYQWNRKKGWPTKQPTSEWTNHSSNGERWETINDPCPKGWRVPTIEELETLLDTSKVACIRTLENEVKGCKFIDKSNSNAVFFPYPGFIHANLYYEAEGRYWSNTLSDFSIDNRLYAYDLKLLPDRINTYIEFTEIGESVRCVYDWHCDTLVTNISVSICAKDLPYEWGDTTFDVGTESGTYSFQRISTVTGCDSIVNLNLTVHASDTSFFDAVCFGSSYDKYGFSLPVVYRDTILHDTLQSVWGCDSVRTLHLTVNPEYHTSLYDTVCRGASYNRYGFSLSDVQTDGDYTLSLSSQAGCDSVLTLHLKVHPVYDTTLYDTICQGNSYSNYGFSLPSGTSGGTFTNTYSTVHGCDSTVTLNLHVHPVYLFSETQHICQGDSISFRGRWLHTSGVYYDSLTTIHGCDSVYRLTLSVHPSPRQNFSGVVCSGSSYNDHGFNLSAVIVDTIVRDTFKTRWGCDSIRTLYLTVHSVYDTTLYDTICQGDSYTNHGFSLPSGTSGGTFTKTYSTVHGCDSTVTLYLHVWPTYFYPETVHLCEGDTFDFRGMRYHESGEYYDSLTTTKGCDSIYCLYLSVHPVYDIQLCGVLCEGIPYTQGGFHVSTPGLHYQYLQSAFGCDSTVTLTLTEEKKIEGSIRVLLEDCSTHGYSFFFDPGDMINHWEWDLGDGTLLRSEECYHQYSDSGTYRIQLHAETYNECENRFSYVQRVPPYLREVVIHSDRQVIDEDYPTVHFRTEVFPGMRCLWDFGDGERGEGDRVSHTYNARTEKYYEVRLQVLNSDSCVTESRMDIEVVFLPKALNTFSPNGDGINDVFMPDYEIEIMDRNGLRIYSGASGWDGTYNGRQAKEDTYFYRLHYRTANGKRQKTGYVTLIR
ncbi:MAG: gliding motility-associated C-terminal domain-containing protein [Odoribacter sp.]|nr:gliding motility-associated C-terminal domain-containing protein [Odoribacter sp.]